MNKLKQAFQVLTGKDRPKAFTQPPFQREIEAGSRRIKLEVMPSDIGPAKGSRYKKAVQSARQQIIQERSYIYDMYQDAIDFDAHLRGLIEKRVLSTTGRKLQYIMPDGEPHEPTQEIIDSPIFDKLRRAYIMRRLFWGMGVFLFWSEKFRGRTWLNFMDVPIKHIDPYEKKIRVTQYSPSDHDQSYENDKYALFVGEADDFGLLLPLALLAIHRRAAMNDWAAYSQLVGTNFRQVMIRDGQDDPKALYEAAKQVYDIGGGTLAHPADVEVRFENASSSSQNQHFTDYMEHTANEMTKLVLGQTMTTEDGSSRSQGEVHERVQETIFDTDAKAELDWLNYEFYEIQDIYDIPKGGKWRHLEYATLKLEQQAEMDKLLKDLGYEFDQQYLRDKYIQD